MRFKSTKHHIDGLIALLLFGVFAACILSVLLTGSEAYRRLTERDRSSFATRTCLEYVATKVRQAGSAESISVDSFDGTNALLITEDIGGRSYVTRVYCYDGWLREIFAAASTEYSASDGEKIIRADSLDFSLDGGLLTATLSDSDSGADSITLSLREEGVRP